MIGHIYKITNNLNGKVYIGQTIQNVRERWATHCRKPRSEYEAEMHIKRAILKYGKENFTFEVIDECDEKQLDEKEVFYISYYNSYKSGYNSTPGGKDCGRCPKLTEEEQKTIADLYNYGFSLRVIAKEFHVDKATVKAALLRHDFKLRSTRSYKLCTEIRQEIVDAVTNGTPRKEVMEKYHISKSYLSQLLSGNRRI
jgi:group I intron endonuclease